VAELRHSGDIALLVLDELAPLGVDAVITTRLGGISRPPYDSLKLGLHVGDEEERVIANREHVAAHLGWDLDSMVFLDQVHGSRVAVVEADAGGRGARAIDNALSATDASVTASHDVVLVVQVADCAPLVLVDPIAGVLGAAHAGWRGMVADVAGATLNAMATLGARPEQTHAVIGPCVDPAHYEVGDEVVTAVHGSLGEDATGCVTSDGTRTTLDLSLANARCLDLAGVPPAAIHRTELATSRRDLFFSDRHARPCGRFALFARLRRDDEEPVASRLQ
jgi:YfiH family protein